ncbi:hypothetical protein HDK90DRAFT_227279 [Phyllosticta capitalensis]|uniref:RING-type domain-containing protein n=1 Tax=Phyllosticta capitalensis TaxID=121624 RepID=A0ABR1YU61_9PEZI
MATQQINMFLPPNYNPNIDYPDETLMEIQSRFLRQLPYATEADARGEKWCPICTDDFVYHNGRVTRGRENSVYAAKLLCDHVMCLKCINEHFIEKDNCPICRAQQFIAPRWTIGQRRKIRRHFDMYWTIHDLEASQILATEPEPNHSNSFKTNTYQYDLTVLAVTYLNELLHTSADSQSDLTHTERVEYTMAVQDALYNWITDNSPGADRLSARRWLPADHFDRVGGVQGKAQFARRVASLTAEFFNRARSVESLVPVDNTELFRHLARWLLDVFGLNREDYDNWKNKLILMMVHCLSHIVTKLDGIGWDAKKKEFGELGDFPPHILNQYRQEAANQFVATRTTQVVNEAQPPPRWNGMRPQMWER